MMLRLTLFAALLAAPAVSAQGIPDWAAPSKTDPYSTPFSGPDDPPPPPIRPPPVPVDGGLALLALAGAGLAARRLRSAE